MIKALGISMIGIWGYVGGLDFVFDSYNCFFKDSENCLNQIKQLQEVILMQENLIEESLQVLLKGEVKIKSDAKILEGAFRVINMQKQKIELYEFIFKENNIEIKDFYKK